MLNVCRFMRGDLKAWRSSKVASNRGFLQMGDARVTSRSIASRPDEKNEADDQDDDNQHPGLHFDAKNVEGLDKELHGRAPLLCKVGHSAKKRNYLYIAATNLLGPLRLAARKRESCTEKKRTQGAEKARSLSNSAGEYLMSSGPMMTTFHPSAESDCALAMAATARSRTVIVTSSFFDAWTMKVTGAGFVRLLSMLRPSNFRSSARDCAAHHETVSIASPFRKSSSAVRPAECAARCDLKPPCHNLTPIGLRLRRISQHHPLASRWKTMR
jgi:hypothetical protein